MFEYLKKLYNHKNKSNKNKDEIIKIEIYEYGNGIYVKPFWDRVNEKIKKVEEEYEIVDRVENFIPKHYIGKNCIGMKTYRGDELFLTLYCKKRLKRKDNNKES